MTIFASDASVALLAVAFAGSLASGVAGGWLTARLERRHRRRADLLRTNVDSAIDAAVALRDGYRRRAGAAAVEARAVSAREDALLLAAERTTPRVVAAARAYVTAGRRFATGDPDATGTREQAAFEALTVALMGARKQR